MNINDPVYGECVVEDECIIELISSKPIQRLKGINQNGIPGYPYGKTPLTRYDHSIGAMLLLQKLGASLEEQIAGLLHDIPHTAFSHIVDYVFDEEEHAYHERFHKKIILNSEIPKILEKFGLDIEYILDEENFPLLERSMPLLCADRIDYTLRDIVANEGMSPRIKSYIDHMIVSDNEIIFDDGEIAYEFGKEFISMVGEIWSTPELLVPFQILAEALRIALDEEIILEEDLFEDDSFVINRLKESNHEEISRKLDMINPKLTAKLNPEDFDYFIKQKHRYVDPRFIDEEGRVTSVICKYPEFIDLLKLHKERVEKGNHIKILNW